MECRPRVCVLCWQRPSAKREKRLQWCTPETTENIIKFHREKITRKKLIIFTSKARMSNEFGPLCVRRRETSFFPPLLSSRPKRVGCKNFSLFSIIIYASEMNDEKRSLLSWLCGGSNSNKRKYDSVCKLIKCEKTRIRMRATEIISS